MTPTQEEHYYLSKSRLLEILEFQRERPTTTPDDSLEILSDEGILPEAVKEEPYGYVTGDKATFIEHSNCPPIPKKILDQSLHSSIPCFYG